MANDSFISRNGICVRLIGDLSLLRPSTLAVAKDLMWRTRNHTQAVLNIACPYTSSQEMEQAARDIKQGLDAGNLLPVDVSQHLMDSCMYTQDCPPLDLMVRTSGEVRLSNFMLWQASRDTFVHFVDVMWPEFSFWHMLPILLCFQCNSFFQQVLNCIV
jgi:ditrans,polycis-polyprenyl diphosphate synthase